MVATLTASLLHYLVVALMLSVGLAARLSDLQQIIRRPTVYARALLVMELLVPILAIVVVSVIRIPPRPTALLLLMAVVPGAPMIPSATKTKGETHSPVGLNLLVLVSLLAPLTVPAWLWLLDRFHPYAFEISAAQVLRQVITVVIAPLALGFTLRWLVPRAADIVGRVAHVFFLVALAVAIAVVLYVGAPVLLDVKPTTLLAALLLVVGAALLGYWAARPRPDDQRIVGVAAALGNPGLALAIVAASYPGFKAFAFMAAYLLFRKLALIPFEQWVKRRKRPAASPPSREDTGHAVGAT